MMSGKPPSHCQRSDSYHQTTSHWTLDFSKRISVHPASTTHDSAEEKRPCSRGSFRAPQAYVCTRSQYGDANCVVGSHHLRGPLTAGLLIPKCGKSQNRDQRVSAMTYASSRNPRLYSLFAEAQIINHS